ncbi:hypothetical protein K438DRAFT_1985448 [Mycena galopus ATCC 62051]|nr:hypothetical protein K438DRAFT_1985448 [Mycena galopus ATCC 62051]
MPPTAQTVIPPLSLQSLNLTQTMTTTMSLCPTLPGLMSPSGPRVHHSSSLRPARASPTMTECLVASSIASSSLCGLVRYWEPGGQRSQLSRLTTANFTVFANTPLPPKLLPCDESTSDGEVSPVWWVAQEPPSASSSNAAPCRHTATGPSTWLQARPHLHDFLRHLNISRFMTTR